MMSFGITLRLQIDDRCAHGCRELTSEFREEHDGVGVRAWTTLVIMPIAS
jgi:hypothetical protein